MSKPTMRQIERLRNCGRDDECYHGEFDNILEEKLKELDPEWIKEMQEEYERSGNARWCA